jgi:hypothetical protein
MTLSRTGSVALMSERVRLKAEIVAESLPSNRSNLAPISRLIVFSGAMSALLAERAKVSPEGW